MLSSPRSVFSCLFLGLAYLSASAEAGPMAWRLCDDNARPVSVQTVTLTPDPPVIGTPATFVVQGMHMTQTQHIRIAAACALWLRVCTVTVARTIAAHPFPTREQTLFTGPHTQRNRAVRLAPLLPGSCAVSVCRSDAAVSTSRDSRHRCVIRRGTDLWHGGCTNTHARAHARL